MKFYELPESAVIEIPGRNSAFANFLEGDFWCVFFVFFVFFCVFFCVFFACFFFGVAFACLG